jgi:hypothetical protein
MTTGHLGDLAASPLQSVTLGRKVQVARLGVWLLTGEWSRSMPYLIVRTDVRQVSAEAVDAPKYARDERSDPERRRQTAMAESRDTALHMARAFASSGPVRSGRQRVKVIRLA